MDGNCEKTEFEEIDEPEMLFISHNELAVSNILQRANLLTREVVEKFKNEQVTDEILPNLKPMHIQQLFVNVGPQAAFERELTKWRSNPSIYMSGEDVDTCEDNIETLNYKVLEPKEMIFRTDFFRLEYILMKYPDSRRLLLRYRNKQAGDEVVHRELLDFERKTVCNTIMICLVNHVKSLRTVDFMSIFSAIQTLFRKELLALYYIPPYSYDVVIDRKEPSTQENIYNNPPPVIENPKTKKVQVTAKGLLFSAWRYRSEKLNSENRALEEALGKPKKKKAKKSSMESDPSLTILEMKEWLKENVEPFEAIIEKWGKTCELRSTEMKKLKVFEKQLSEWPRYSKKLGYQLIEIDFIHAFSGKNNFKRLWPKYRQNIIDMALISANKKSEKDKQRNKDIIKNLGMIKENTDEEGNLAGFLAMQALFFLLPNKNNYVKQNLDKILLKAEKGSKVDDIIFELSLQQTKTKKFHPIIIYYEDKDYLPYKFYTCVNDVKYELENITTAIDVLFKIFFVFNLGYPGECLNLLTFLQQFFFDIFLEDDHTSVTALGVMVGVDSERAGICNRKILDKEFDDRRHF
ncbi:hypothetical protein ACFFRR_007120 [Megaselia abdita]